MKEFKQCINNLLDKNSLLKDDDINSKKDIKQSVVNQSYFKNKFFYFHIVLASACTLILFYFLLIYLNVYTLNGKEFELKNFQSLSLDELETEIESLNIEYIITDSVYTDSVPRGTIFTQDPLPGTFVKPGRKIYVTVNCINRQRFKLPDIYNKSKRQSVNQLKSHFKIEFVKSEKYSDVSSVVTKMMVGDTEVFPGQKLIEGTTIKLFFGNGRGMNKIIVPNLTGISIEEAFPILEGNNLKLGEIICDGQIKDTLTAIIINQRPLTETTLQSGDMIDIVIKQFLDTLITSDSIFTE